MNPSPFTDVSAAFVAFLYAVGPAALGIQVAIEWLRGLLASKFNITLSGNTLIPVSVVLGVGAAIIFHLNFIGPLLVAVPAFATQHLSETAGQVLTGIGVAGASGYWHVKKAAKKAEAVVAGAPGGDVRIS